MRNVTLVAVALFLQSTPAAGQRGTVSVDTLRWMAGCWQHSGGATIIDETWLPPRGGVMMGVARTVTGSRVRDAEFTRILLRGDTLVFAPQPLGQAAAEFRMTKLLATEVVFENLAHDYPKRIGYQRASDDSLVAFIEGENPGVGRRWFRYARSACRG